MEIFYLKMDKNTNGSDLAEHMKAKLEAGVTKEAIVDDLLKTGFEKEHILKAFYDIERKARKKKIKIINISVISIIIVIALVMILFFAPKSPLKYEKQIIIEPVSETTITPAPDSETPVPYNRLEREIERYNNTKIPTSATPEIRQQMLEERFPDYFGVG
ncbi:hypothetical protein ACFL6I_16210 [candidate division KSB1 bacterium]